MPQVPRLHERRLAVPVSGQRVSAGVQQRAEDGGVAALRRVLQRPPVRQPLLRRVHVHAGLKQLRHPGQVTGRGGRAEVPRLPRLLPPAALAGQPRLQRYHLCGLRVATDARRHSPVHKVRGDEDKEGEDGGEEAVEAGVTVRAVGLAAEPFPRVSEVLVAVRAQRAVVASRAPCYSRARGVVVPHIGPSHALILLFRAREERPVRTVDRRTGREERQALPGHGKGRGVAGLDQDHSVRAGGAGVRARSASTAVGQGLPWFFVVLILRVARQERPAPGHTCSVVVPVIAHTAAVGAANDALWADAAFTTIESRFASNPHVQPSLSCRGHRHGRLTISALHTEG